MTTLEILFSIVSPLLLLGWAGAYASGRVWRDLAQFWRDQALNTRRQHPLRECIRRASIKRHGQPQQLN